MLVSCIDRERERETEMGTSKFYMFRFLEYHRDFHCHKNRVSTQTGNRLEKSGEIIQNTGKMRKFQINIIRYF